MDLMGGGLLCCVGVGKESRETGVFERLSGQRDMDTPMNSTWVSASGV